MRTLITLILINFILQSCDSPHNNEETKIKPPIEAEPVEKTENDIRREVEEAAKPAYVKAYAEIASLRSNIDLAEKGTVDKSDVINLFNRTVGVVMGRESSFTGVKNRIEKGGDSYIQYQFQKEIARIAFERAGESQFKAEQLDK